MNNKIAPGLVVRLYVILEPYSIHLTNIYQMIYILYNVCLNKIHKILMHIKGLKMYFRIFSVKIISYKKSKWSVVYYIDIPNNSRDRIIKKKQGQKLSIRT